MPEKKKTKNAKKSKKKKKINGAADKETNEPNPASMTEPVSTKPVKKMKLPNLVRSEVNESSTDRKDQAKDKTNMPSATTNNEADGVKKKGKKRGRRHRVGKRERAEKRAAAEASNQ